MHDELQGRASARLRRQRLVRQRVRCLKATKLTLIGAAVGIAYLCLGGMEPAAVAVPVLLAVISLLCAAVSAALFAHLARVYLEQPDQDADDDGGGPGWGSGEPLDPPGGGEHRVDWDQFERDFRSYCERVVALAGE